MLRFLSERMSFMVMHSMLAPSNLWTSVDGNVLVLTSVRDVSVCLHALTHIHICTLVCACVCVCVCMCVCVCVCVYV